MLKRILVLVGTVTVGLVALWGLTWLIPSPPQVAYADPARVPSHVPDQAGHRRPASQATGCVTVTSNIVTNTTWTAPCYRLVTSTVTIHPQATLTISPPVTGTWVEFQAGAQLQVLGNLQALGTPSRPITFTSASTTSPSPCNGVGRWIGIILEDDSGGDRIQHSLIEYACTGIRINDEDRVEILSNTLRFNGGSGSRNGAIGGDTDQSRIANNQIYSCTNGIMLGESFQNRVISNTIHDVDGYGLMLLRDMGPGGSDNRISDNEVYRCGRGGLWLEQGSGNQVLSNTVYLNTGGAIYLADQGLASVSHNHVYSNGGGSGYRAALYFTGTSDLASVVANVLYDEQADAIEYTATGSSASPSMTLNALCSVPAYELQAAASPTVNAPHNWWGTNTPAAGVNYAGPVVLDPRVTLALTGTADGMVLVTLRDSDGHTVPAPSGRPTSPPAPNARRVALSTSWGTLNPPIVFVDNAGIATAMLVPAATPAPATIVLTATGFCGYAVTGTLEPPRLWVTKSAETCIAPGEAFDYQITYQNITTGTTFYSAGLTDTLPLSVSYTGGPEWACVGRVCSRTVVSIPPGISGTLQLPVQLSAAFPYTLQATIANGVAIQGGNRFTLTTSIESGPDLVVVKNDNVGPLPLVQQARWEALAQQLSISSLPGSRQVAQHPFVTPGERITYTILYVNAGVGPASGVVLTETLPQYTHYIGGGWTYAGGRQYVLPVGNLAPGQGGAVTFIVQVDDPFPPGVERVVNRVDVDGGTPECDTGNNVSADDTPVHTDGKLYVANRLSGTIDVFNTTSFDYLTTIPVGLNPYGMAVYSDHLFVADFAESATHGSLYVVDTLGDTVVATTTVGAHPIHVAASGGTIYIAGHSGPPPVTLVRASPPWDVVAELYLDRYQTYEFGFFGATADPARGSVYMTKPDFGGIGVWRVTPVTTTWRLDYVYPTSEAQRQRPRSILYHAGTDRVYAAMGLIDELWVFDPGSWTLLERIRTGHQDPANPGYGGHGLAALGQCIFVSNYLGESVTAVIDGDCVERPGSGLVPAPAGPYTIYLPLIGRGLISQQRIVTIPVNGRPEGMAGLGNLLFVTLSSANRVAIINTETLTVVGEIAVLGAYPHTVVVAGGNPLSPTP